MVFELSKSYIDLPIDPGGVCTIERNDNYYIMGEDVKPLPYVDEYRIVPIGEPLANLAALKSVEIHIVYQIAYDIIEQATLEPEIVVMGSPTQGYHPIVLNLDPEIGCGSN